jgi:hypothetical protein
MFRYSSFAYIKVNVTEVEPNRKVEKFSHIKRTRDTTGAARKTVKSEIPKTQEIRNLLSCLMTCKK